MLKPNARLIEKQSLEKWKKENPNVKVKDKKIIWRESEKGKEWRKEYSEKYNLKYYSEKRQNPMWVQKQKLYKKLYNYYHCNELALKQQKRLERLVTDSNGQTRIYELLMIQRLIDKGRVNGKIRKVESEYRSQAVFNYN